MIYSPHGLYSSIYFDCFGRKGVGESWLIVPVIYNMIINVLKNQLCTSNYVNSKIDLVILLMNNNSNEIYHLVYGKCLQLNYIHVIVYVLK